MMKHGIHVDLVPKKLGGEGAIYIDEEHIPFEWDDEKFFWKTSKPNEEDLESLETFELNLPIHDMALETGTCHRKRKWRSMTNIPMWEWRKRLAMLPEAVVEKMLENSTNLYLNIEAENREDPRRHYKYRFPGL
eukprot:4846203-Ditylum_brightwellii.AAC.1